MKEKNRKPMGARAEKTTASIDDDSIRVWVIEDHVDFRATVMRVLSLEADFAAQSFERCEEALALFKSGATAHVILLDIGLPGMSGLEAITLFKAASPPTQIIMLTAFDDPPKVRKAIQAGATGYLLKTAEAREITRSVREVLDGGAPLDTHIARHVLAMVSGGGGVDRYGLAPRERETLEGLVAGKTVKEIASDMQVSYHTVDTYLRRLYEKMDVQSRSLAVSKALQERLI
jgi:DNA-binding NarL/FixJ family response regulator